MPRAGCVWWLHLGEKGNRCIVLWWLHFIKPMEKSVIVFIVHCKHAVIGVGSCGRGSNSKLCFRCGEPIFKKMKIFVMQWEVDNFLPITRWKKKVIFIWLEMLDKNMTHRGEITTKITLLISLRYLVHSLIFLYVSILRP